ncbi:MAG: hypothetical protein ABR567_01200 [Myxococcales bacterium]|nr:hypothetical protein [Myxococcales bacterium]
MTALLLSALLAVAPHGREGDAQAFTALTDAQGKPIADARYAQWVIGDVLHVESRADFPDGRSIVEQTALRLHPRIEQLSWTWTEHNGELLVREYTIDFVKKKAIATRVDQRKRWKEDVDVEPGKSFAGIGFMTVVKALRGQLKPGQSVELQAVAMTPKPRTVTVTVRRDGADPVHMAGRTIEADRYTIHPEIPAIAKLFVSAPDEHIWLIGRDPAAFLRFEGPLVEPGDPVIHIDLIPSAPVRPQARAPHRHR